MKRTKAAAFCATGILLLTFFCACGEPGSTVGQKSSAQAEEQRGEPEAQRPASEQWPDPEPIDPASYIPHYQVLKELKAAYHVIGGFADERIYVSLLGSHYYGYADLSGEIAVPLAFENPAFLVFSEGLAGFYTGDNSSGFSFGYMDVDGNTVIEPVLERGYPFVGGVAAAWVPDQGSRYIDRNGEPISAYTAAWSIGTGKQIETSWEPRYGEEGLYPVTDGEHYGFIGADGTLRIALEYRDAGVFDGGLAPVQDQSGLWGYIGPDGQYEIEPQFYAVRPFSEGVAAVLYPDHEILNLNPDTPGASFSQYYVPYSFIDREGNLLREDVASMPIHPGAATDAPEELSCKNGIICGSSGQRWLGVSNELYNRQLQPLDIRQDLPATLYDDEKPFVRVWELCYQEDQWLLGNDVSSNNALLKLYENRDAVILDLETDEVLDYGVWASRGANYMGTVYFQSHTGDTLCVTCLPVERRLYGERVTVDYDTIPLQERLPGAWAITLGSDESQRFWFEADGSYIYGDNRQHEVVYSMGDWWMEEDILFLSASTLVINEGGTYRRLEVPSLEREVERYPVARDSGNLTIGKDLFRTLPQSGDLSSFLAWAYGDMYDFRDDNQAFQERLALWNGMG